MDHGTQKAARAQRRRMTAKHKKKLLRYADRRCLPWAGYTKWHRWRSGGFPPARYARYPKNSNLQRHLKRQSNRVIRRRKGLHQHGQYRKCFEYQWSLW